MLTDNKPLVQLLRPDSVKNLPPRIQRLSWRMQQYNYEIKHIIGKANIANSLSRLPLKKLDKTTSGHVCEEYVKFVVESDVSDTASAVSLRDVKDRGDCE